MTTEPRLSDRLAAVVDALPLRPGMRVLEIGGAPGAAAKAVARRIGNGHILVIDRSATGIALTDQNAAAEIAAGLLSVRHVAAEDFELLPGEPPFDLIAAAIPPRSRSQAPRRIPQGGCSRCSGGRPTRRPMA